MPAQCQWQQARCTCTAGACGSISRRAVVSPSNSSRLQAHRSRNPADTSQTHCRRLHSRNAVTASSSASPLFLLLPLDNGRAAGVRGRRFTSKAGQREAHLAASLETWPRVRRAFRSLFARRTRSAYGGCFERRRSLPCLVKSPQHSTGSFATVLCERECRALACAEATRP